jgi:hypothetical protein
MAPCSSANKAKFWQERSASKARRSFASLTRYLGALLRLCTFFALAATVATADPAADLTTRFGGVYRRPLTGNPASLDPAHATDIYAHTVVNFRSLTAWCSLTITSILSRPCWILGGLR